MIKSTNALNLNGWSSTFANDCRSIVKPPIYLTLLQQYIISRMFRRLKAQFCSRSATTVYLLVYCIIGTFYLIFTKEKVTSSQLRVPRQEQESTELPEISKNETKVKDRTNLKEVSSHKGYEARDKSYPNIICNILCRNAK